MNVCAECVTPDACKEQDYCEEPLAHPVCPACKSTDTERHHHFGSYAVPECWYFQCASCSHQWGHE